METIPHVRCVACGAEICLRMCMATQDNRYCCHNPRCMFYLPWAPSSATQAPAQAAEPATGGDTTTVTEWSGAVPSTDPNVICRETIVREWRLVGAQTGTVTTEQASTAAAPTPASTTLAAPTAAPALPTPTSASPSPAADAPPRTQVDRSSTPPATFTIEEIEAHQELLARYQGPPVRTSQRGHQGARTGRGGPGARTRRPVLILLN